MRRFCQTISVLLTVCLSGCHSNSRPAHPDSDSYAARSISISEMEAEYTKLQTQNDRDCLYASPSRIKADQDLCARERKQMAPLGNALMQAKIKAAQRATNP